MSTMEDREALDAAAREELEAFAATCNPRIEFFDPIGLADANFWGSSDAATIAFLRHAEMKHGRVAMLAFLGFILQANELIFPWSTPENGFPPRELSPPEQWDVLDPKAKFEARKAQARQHEAQRKQQYRTRRSPAPARRFS